MLIPALVGAPLLADQPLPPPEKVAAWSENHTYMVESVPNGETTVYRVLDGKELWTIPGWHRSVFVSDTGFVAIGYEGINLLPLNYRFDVVLIELWHDGRMTHRVRLRDLVQNPKLLLRTASHYYWGYVSGFNTSNLLEVVTLKSKVYIDPQNGRTQTSQHRSAETHPRVEEIKAITKLALFVRLSAGQ